jgi:probable HAF family extracellular repeat protein
MRIGAVVLFVSVPLLGNPFFSITDIGTLGGASATGYAISNSGIVAGFGENSSGNQSAFSYNGQLTALSATGALSSQANGVNSSGFVAGTVFTSSGAVGGIWSGTVFSGVAGPGSYAMDINDQGWVVGSAQGDAFIDKNGVLTNLGTLAGGTWSSAYSLNGAGQVAGYGDTGSGNFHAFLWTANSGMADLGTLGGSSSYAMGINGDGNIVGSSTDSSGFLQAFLWTHSGMQSLGALPGATSSMGYGINSSGSVVGYSGAHAFLWINGIMTDLNTLIPLGSGWELDAAYGISDSGEIVGTGTDNGQSHAFLLDPGLSPPSSLATFSLQVSAPEPNTAPVFVLLVAGFLAMACYHQRNESRNVGRAAEAADPGCTQSHSGRLGQGRRR